MQEGSKVEKAKEGKEPIMDGSNVDDPSEDGDVRWVIDRRPSLSHLFPRSTDAAQDGGNVAKETEDEKDNEKDNENEKEDCAVCMNARTAMHMTQLPCAHRFCIWCIVCLGTRQNMSHREEPSWRCPLCRRSYAISECDIFCRIVTK